MPDSDIKQRFEKVLTKFQSNEQYLMHNDIGERALVHKLAEYLQDEFQEYNVDCEFNRNLEEVKRLQKIKEYVQSRRNSGELSDYEEKYGVNVSPDVIVHIRGNNNNNKIIIEIKKSDSPLDDEEFDKFGIKVLGEKNYYYLPKIPEKSMDKKKVFLDSLMICEKEGGVRNILFVALFYLKYRNDLKGVISPVLENIKTVIEGKRIRGYPSVDEIKEKAKLPATKVAGV